MHEEIRWHFPIAANGALMALTFVPFCILHFWFDCNELSGAFEPSISERHFRQYFFSHEYRVIEISKVCIHTGSVRNGWKFLVAKRTEFAL